MIAVIIDPHIMTAIIARTFIIVRSMFSANDSLSMFCKFALYFFIESPFLDHAPLIVLPISE